MKKDTPFLKNLKQTQKLAKEISNTMLDKMIDGREFESLLKYQFENVNLIAEIRKSIKEIEAIRKIPLACYAANVVKQGQVPTGIDGSDDLPFNEMIRSIPPDQKELDIALVTPGGSANQVAKFVNTLRPRFDKVNFILLNQAMSAGTIFALSGDQIIMSRESNLGPIDPQIRNGSGQYIPAQSLNILLEQIRKRGEEAIGKKEQVAWTDLQIIRNVEFLKEVANSQSASKYSIQLAEQYLNNYKFKSWINHSNGNPVAPSTKESRSKDIANLLCEHSKWNNHGHAITREAAWDVCKLKIVHAESANIEREMRRMWALFYWIFDFQNLAKLFVSEKYCVVRGNNIKKP